MSKSQEQYQPSEEEIGKAEGSLTELQGDASKLRERVTELQSKLSVTGHIELWMLNRDDKERYTFREYIVGGNRLSGKLNDHEIDIIKVIFEVPKQRQDGEEQEQDSEEQEVERSEDFRGNIDGVVCSASTAEEIFTKYQELGALMSEMKTAQIFAESQVRNFGREQKLKDGIKDLLG